METLKSNAVVESSEQAGLTPEQQAEIERIQGEINKLTQEIDSFDKESSLILAKKDEIGRIYKMVFDLSNDKYSERSLLQTKLDIIKGEGGKENKNFLTKFYNDKEVRFKDEQNRRLNSASIKEIEEELEGDLSDKERSSWEGRLIEEKNKQQKMIKEEEETRRNLEEWRKSLKKQGE